MHKSILFLMGSLVMLLPFVPNINIFSSAMAIADYGNTDQYMKYGQDMMNKNYDNSNSNSIQKIKCNNINSNLNGIEANIGTNDPLRIGTASLQEDPSTNSAL